jgi:hypothetical protein
MCADSTIDEKQSKQLETSHPRAYEVYLNIKRVGVVERYLMGRQLCVIAIVFLISQLTSFPTMPSVLPHYLQRVLIDTGLPGVMITLIIGQLFPQLIADEYTIRFLNIKGSLFFIKVAEVLESVGIFTNCSWVVSYILSNYVFRWNRTGATPEGDVENPMDNLDIGASTHNLLLKLRESYNGVTQGSESFGTDNENYKKSIEMKSSDTENRTNVNRYKEYDTAPTSASGRTLLSLSTTATDMNIEQLNPNKSGLVTSSTTLIKLVASTVFTLAAASIIVYGIFYQQPLLQLNPLALVALLLVCMTVEFYLEGLQVAVLAMQHRESSTIPTSLSGTQRIHKYVTEDRKGELVKRFLIGRQFFVVLSMFTMASITSYESFEHFELDILPRKVIGLFVLTGFCGVVFALNTVQLPAQILAKQYPLQFLNLPGAYLFIRLTLLIDQTGIMHFGWILFHCSKGLFQNE